MALPYCVLGGRQFFGRTVDSLLARDPLLLSRSIAGLPGAHGMGLRPHCEPARGDAHARESLSQHADPPAAADRRAFLDVEPRTDCHPVGRRCRRRIDQRRTGLATTAPESSGVKEAGRRCRTLRIAAIQMIAAPREPESRRARAETLVERAASEGAALVALREMFAPGYLASREVWDLAEPLDRGPTVAWLQRTDGDSAFTWRAGLSKRTDETSSTRLL